MDDLTGVGRIDVLDADVLYGIVEEIDADPALAPLLGGLGKYRTTPSHGPFVNIDTRGVPGAVVSGAESVVVLERSVEVTAAAG